MKRSKWKGPLIKFRDSKKKLPILPREYQVISSVVGLNCNVHSGKKFVTLSLTEDMIGHKLGEFVPTRERFEFKKKKKKK
ncbi:MAG: ribosomal protein S19 family protein [Gammaproteobacteria bacterium]|nr:ribosomal protein S19 family protein [Gammaproteobacteria bacterium]